MKCWIFFKKRKKDRYQFSPFAKLNPREMHNFPWFTKLNSCKINKISRKAWFANFLPAQFSDKKVVCKNQFQINHASHLNGSSKSEAIESLQNIVLIGKRSTLSEKRNILKLKKYKEFESIYKNGGKKYKIWWYWNRKTKISPI